MKPRERNNYKSTQIIESESPHKNVLIDIVLKFKKLSDTTLLQKMQHKSSLMCTQVITKKNQTVLINLFRKLVFMHLSKYLVH